LVGTVEVTVATPVQRYASVVFDAREFGLGASDVGAVELVRAILTVVVSVTHPNLLNTLSIAAGKLIVPTRFVCSDRENKIIIIIKIRLASIL